MKRLIQKAVSDAYDAGMEQLSVPQKLAQRLKILIIMYAGVLFIGGVIFSFAEKKPLGDSLWWAVVTASSVGYGDIYPVTVIGRITGAILMNIVLLVLVPLLTARFSAQMIVDSDKFTHEEQEEIKGELRVILALVKSLEANQKSIDKPEN